MLCHNAAGQEVGVVNLNNETAYLYSLEKQIEKQVDPDSKSCVKYVLGDGTLLDTVGPEDSSSLSVTFPDKACVITIDAIFDDASEEWVVSCKNESGEEQCVVRGGSLQKLSWLWEEVHKKVDPDGNRYFCVELRLSPSHLPNNENIDKHIKYVWEKTGAKDPELGMIFGMGLDKRPSAAQEPEKQAATERARVHDSQVHKEPAQLTQAECRAHAIGEKEAGNVAFKAQNWDRAIGRYEEGTRYVLYASGHHGEPLSDEDRVVAVALLSNCAAAHLKQGHAEQAVEACARALCLDMLNAKVYFRRAHAWMALGDYEHAKEDVLRILDLEPENKDAQQLRLRIVHEATRAKQKDKAFCAKMFG
mmetsp:Transcript_81417/g.141033  ORF Transcript_81417/g.141033 Transcript_81417/m.141033 type:complete len:362 (+) Transcript_81417:1-1086(+)